MTKTIDCFPFFDELDLLEIRLNELKDVVDLFILTESPYTFTGIEKPLYYEENKDRFAAFNIIHTVFHPTSIMKPMQMEKAQKQYNIDCFFHVAAAGDVLIQGDVDEIPRASTLTNVLKDDWTSAMLAMDLFYYYLNCKGTTAKRWYKNSRVLRPKERFEYNVRQDSPNDRTYYHAGWHFSYLGDIQAKLAAWGHAPKYNKPPYNTKEHIERCKTEGLDLIMRKGLRKITFEFLDDLSYLPQYVLDNLDKFNKYIKHG